MMRHRCSGGRGFRRAAICAFAILFLGMAATPALAAAPNIKHLFPPGAQRGSKVEIKATGDFSTWPIKTWTSDSGLSLECKDDKGKLEVSVAADTKPGVYLVRAYNDEGASRPVPFIVGNLAEVIEKSENDSPHQAELLPAVVTVNGRLEKRDDVDVYAVELSEGQTLVASLMANETLASPMDAVLQVVSSDGIVLAQNHDWHGLDPQIVFHATSAGKYLVRVFAFPAQPDSRIGLAGGDDYLYRLTVTIGPFVDFAWPLAVQQKTPTDVELVGWNLDDAVRRQTIAADGESCALTGDGLAGDTAVAVEPHRCIVEAEPNRSETPQPIELPLTISGRLTAGGDIDVYRFGAKGGETIVFTLDSRELGSPLDAVLQVTDTEGKSLARSDDAEKRRDPQLTWKSPRDGDYCIAVSDLEGEGGDRMFYRLRATVAKPDFRIKSAEHAFSGDAGKPLEIKLEIDRINGFNDEIVFRVEGLPASITAEPATSQSKGETAKKVALTLNSAEPFSGPCRIVASPAKDDSQPRTAAFVLPDQTECHDLWLTFRPPGAK